ncbi:MAG: Gfo/Idh/MocA family oxidoreductase [bacterium]|nr:Gfo/Idh/MocA family oxidoreductase [bacterium]
MSVKVAVVGLGIGKVHLEHYSEIKGVEIVGGVDINPDVRKSVEKDYGIKCYNSSEELLRNVIPDGVSICTPPDTHLYLTKICAEKGVHILCEKPMAPSIKDCEKMIEICKKNKVILLIGFKKRFAPAYRFLKEKFEKEFGVPKSAVVKFGLGRVGNGWFWDEKSGGGPVIENAVHMVDLMHFFFGDVESVYGVGGNLFMHQYAPQVDTALFVMRFKNGGVASIGSGYLSEWGFAKEEVMISTEKVVCEVKGPFDSPKYLEYIKRESPSSIHKKTFPDADGFKDEIKHFVDCIKRKQIPAVDSEAGLYALKVCLAIKKSVRSGKVVYL